MLKPRILPLVVSLAVLLCASVAQAQSLAELARRNQQQKTRSAAKIYTNDDLPITGTVNVVGTVPPPADSAAPDSTAPETSEAASADVTAAESSDGDAGKNAKTASEPARRDQELRSSATKAKETISELEREVDLLNREFRLRAATYYADAGNSLRDPKQWADQQRQHETDMAEKTAALESAKQKYTEIEDQARRVGVALEQ